LYFEENILLKINIMNRKTALLFAFVFGSMSIMAQRVGSSPEYIKALTTEWEGERFDDGRPKVSDDLLERLKAISMEEAWGVLRNKGFFNQYEGNWHVMNPEEVMTGRVVTAQYMPSRPDLQNQVKEQGKIEERAQTGGTNS
jgi:4-hydroxy-4-methyl-2-oxoglutarate aldolase